MQRSVSFFRPVQFGRAALAATVLCAFSALQTARADEFSLLPTGDPIYGQLSGLARPGEAKPASLTRYEAALQTARALIEIQNRDPKRVSGAQWRALKGLVTALRSELSQLGVDVGAALELAQNGLKPAKAPAIEAPVDFTPRTAPVKTTAPRTGALLLSSPGPSDASVRNTSIAIPLSQRLRVESARLAVERSTQDPFAASFGAAPRGGISQGGAAQKLASQNTLSYDFSRWLTLRAATSQRELGGAQGDSPLLSAPLFAGATEAKAAGGGLDFNVGPDFKISTEIERLRADTGASAARIGGGAELSLWQNRLSMSMHLSRLLPEDEATLSATAAQLGVGVDVSRRLSLNLLYQGLFAESKDNNAGRVSGGVSLSF
ncbi:MAG: hypothetical protein KY445_02365 [Armatimonadetes bacterium]|nr:hypothetical protein [Armatimonadota bacterium]